MGRLDIDRLLCRRQVPDTYRAAGGHGHPATIPGEAGEESLLARGEQLVRQPAGLQVPEIQTAAKFLPVAAVGNRQQLAVGTESEIERDDAFRGQVDGARHLAATDLPQVEDRTRIIAARQRAAVRTKTQTTRGPLLYLDLARLLAGFPVPQVELPG